jgi:type IV fimbrial biogenesis protein FimT
MLVTAARPGRRRAASGFTLIEAMVVVALLAIVGTLAAPSFRAFIGTMNAKSAAFDLINDLSMARSEAIKSNWTVRVVPEAGDWTKGWRIVRDAGAPGDPDNVDDVVLRVRPALTSALSVTGVPNEVQFRPNGRLDDDTASGNVAWSVTSTISGVTPRCIVISPTGSARSKMGACS